MSTRPPAPMMIEPRPGMPPDERPLSWRALWRVVAAGDLARPLGAGAAALLVVLPFALAVGRAGRADRPVGRDRRAGPGRAGPGRRRSGWSPCGRPGRHLAAGPFELAQPLDLIGGELDLLVGGAGAAGRPGRQTAGPLGPPGPGPCRGGRPPARLRRRGRGAAASRRAALGPGAWRGGPMAAGRRRGRAGGAAERGRRPGERAAGSGRRRGRGGAGGVGRGGRVCGRLPSCGGRLPSCGGRLPSCGTRPVAAIPGGGIVGAGAARHDRLGDRSPRRRVSRRPERVPARCRRRPGPAARPARRRRRAPRSGRAAPPLPPGPVGRPAVSAAASWAWSEWGSCRASAGRPAWPGPARRRSGVRPSWPAPGRPRPGPAPGR